MHTHEGFLYLASVIDVFSRRVIGWAIASHMRAELVCDALRMALANRRGRVRGVIFHSDRGASTAPRASESWLSRPEYVSPWAVWLTASTMLSRNRSSLR